MGILERREMDGGPLVFRLDLHQNLFPEFSVLRRYSSCYFPLLRGSCPDSSLLSGRLDSDAKLRSAGSALQDKTRNKSDADLWFLTYDRLSVSLHSCSNHNPSSCNYQVSDDFCSLHSQSAQLSQLKRSFMKRSALWILSFASMFESQSVACKFLAQYYGNPWSWHRFRINTDKNGLI